MEQLTSIVSSRGIQRSCATRNATPVSSSPQLDPGFAVGHRAGGSIYVCTEALPAFTETILPTIREPFVLVTGDSDLPIDPARVSLPGVQALLGNPLLERWFAQNLAVHHLRISAMPIGQDYHTMWARPGFWGLSQTSAIAQEHLLFSTYARSPAFFDRYLVGYCNWHFAIERGDRKRCAEEIDRTVCFFENQPVPRASTWARQAECMFVISPEGAGLDCHRTWEALLLGCIPVVKRSSLSVLFERLPVLVVDEWAQVTRSSLTQYLQSLGERTFDFSSLFLEHWRRRIDGASPVVLEPMTHAGFRKFLTRSAG